MNVTTAIGTSYLHYWVKALHEYLGWSRARVVEWASQFEADLNDDDSLLWREYPMLYSSAMLIPRRLESTLNELDRYMLLRKLESATLVLPFDERSVDSYDWNAAIARINAILAEYDESLANAKRR